MTFTIFQNGKEKKEWRTYKTKQGTQYIQVPCTDFEKAVQLAENYYEKKQTSVQVFDNTETLVYEVKPLDLFTI
jgi:hypothetical protein